MEGPIPTIVHESKEEGGKVACRSKEDIECKIHKYKQYGASLRSKGKAQCSKRRENERGIEVRLKLDGRERCLLCSEESDLITDTNDMSLGSENFSSDAMNEDDSDEINENDQSFLNYGDQSMLFLEGNNRNMSFDKGISISEGNKSNLISETSSNEDVFENILEVVSQSEMNANYPNEVYGHKYINNMKLPNINILSISDISKNFALSFEKLEENAEIFLPMDAKLLSLILYSDATNVDVIGKKQIHPIFVIIGNIKNWRHNKQDAKQLLKYLLILKARNNTKKQSENFKNAVHEVFHKFLDMLLDPILSLNDSINLDLNNEKIWFFSQISIIIADWPEAAIYCLTYNQVTNRMHHLDLGLFHYLIEYTRDILRNQYGNSLMDEIDRKLAAIPRFIGLKVFTNGLQLIARLTADEHHNLMKVIIFVINNLYKENTKSLLKIKIWYSSMKHGIKCMKSVDMKYLKKVIWINSKQLVTDIYQNFPKYFFLRIKVTETTLMGVLYN
ncbi:hypothetical protein C1645_827479 [Glomus cerebriforme]|uniref:Uncharacterized protein n=1 Tax=Glomus cerebriforme TaxID=658196 RepID=A0A397SSR1_9GLOM|nr:hypothetical protein C1645_827479 [Glomus cerebriforme]